jgi:ATP-binding cassette subfamily B protein
VNGSVAHDPTVDLDRRRHDRLLVAAARQGGPSIGLLALTALLIAIAETALPAFVGRAFDAVTGTAPQVWVTRCALLIGVLAICDAVDDLVVGTVTARTTTRFRRSVLRHLLAIGPRAARQFPPGDLAGRLVANTAEVGALAPNVVRAAANLVPAIGGVVALGLIDPWLAVTFLVGMPVFLLLLRAFARDASGIASRYLDVQGTIAGRLGDALSGARTIAAAGTAQREVDRVLEPLPELHEHGVAMWRSQLRISVQDAVLVPLMEIVVLAVAGLQLARGRITPGEMLAAGQYVLLASTLGSAVNIVARLARARAAAGRVGAVLAEAPIAYGAERLPPGPGQIELREVTVLAGGGGEHVLDRVNLVVPAGALAAVVGPSGSGKSLLAALVGRLVDPDRGQVLLDGVDVRHLEQGELRGAVAYGFERPVLMGGTLAEVIAFGHGDVDHESIVTAARAAHADGFIRRMPQGYETRLDAAPMSGGEVQRLGLARAFAHGGRVLVLDDVAASLDSVTEHNIRQVLTSDLADRTRIVVAHRASTAAGADLVVWLERGGVRAVGSHDELWRDPDYRRLFEADAAGPTPDDAAAPAQEVA